MATALTEGERALVLEHCLRANNSRMIEPYPAYKHLHELFRTLEAQGGPALRYLSDHFFYDVLIWYHLAWTGETVRRESEVVPRLMAIGQHFEPHHRHELFRLIGDLVRGVVGRYARLAEAGRIELSTTPHYHPLAPLLLDFQSAREAEPKAQLPETPNYPGGRERVMAQLQSALESHARRFGAAPRGVWPAEGSVSAGLLGVLSGNGLAWVASSEQVLANSLGAAHRGVPRSHYLYRPYRLGSAPDLALFFRDDKLSDRIGFEYQKWHGSDAAANFIGELECIAAEASQDERPLVSVILDGENAWEHYPYNAYYFLSALYKALESHPSIRPNDVRGVFAGVLEQRWCGRWQAARRNAKTRSAGRRELGVRQFLHLDRIERQEPRLGSVMRRQAELRLGEGKRAPRRRGPGRRRAAVGRLRRFGLVLVVRRLQPERFGGEFRPAVPRQARQPVPADRIAGACGAV